MRILRITCQIVPWLLVVLLFLHTEPSRSSKAKLNQTITNLSTQLRSMQQEQQMPALVLRKHRNAICYIFAEYTFDWPSNVPVRRPERHTRVSGTGFLVSSDQIASNRHVLQPWFEDTDDQEAIRMGAKPRLEKLVAFFPGMMDSLRLTDVHVARDQDLAVARLADGPLPNIIGPLPLAESEPEAGDPVIVVGYPLGVSAMLAKTPDGLYRRLASSKDTGQVAQALAIHELIRPSATCGHIGDIVDSKLIYDAPTAQGGSGGPVFNSRGEVIAVNSAYIEGFGGGTIGISVEGLKPLLRRESRD